MSRRRGAKVRKASRWQDAIVVRTLLMVKLCAALPLALGMLYVHSAAWLPYGAELHPWLPAAVAGLGAGLPALITLWTLLCYLTGRFGLDPGEGVAVAIGAGFAPMVALAMLIQQTGWAPVYGLPQPGVAGAALLALLVPAAQLTLFGLAALALPKNRRAWRTARA